MATPPTKAMAATMAATGTIVPVVPVGDVPSSMDPPGQITTIGPVATDWSTQQPPFPTVFPPPPPLPTVQLGSAGMIPWSQWVNTMAVRPYATDPPPCPVVVSSYPGLTRN